MLLKDIGVGLKHQKEKKNKTKSIIICILMLAIVFQAVYPYVRSTAASVLQFCETLKLEGKKFAC